MLPSCPPLFWVHPQLLHWYARPRLVAVADWRPVVAMFCLGEPRYSLLFLDDHSWSSHRKETPYQRLLLFLPESPQPILFELWPASLLFSFLDTLKGKATQAPYVSVTFRCAVHHLKRRKGKIQTLIANVSIDSTGMSRLADTRKVLSLHGEKSYQLCAINQTIKMT